MNLKKLLSNPLFTVLTLLAFNAYGGQVEVSPAPAGRFAYVTNFNEGTISMFTVDAVTGDLRHNGYVAAGAGPISVTVDPAGRFAYVANNVSNDISVYRINPTSGILTAAGVPVFASRPRYVSVDPTGKFVYVENKNPNTVSAYRIDAATGALTSLGTVRNRARAFSLPITRGGSGVAYTPKYAGI